MNSSRLSELLTLKKLQQHHRFFWFNHFEKQTWTILMQFNKVNGFFHNQLDSREMLELIETKRPATNDPCPSFQTKIIPWHTKKDPLKNFPANTTRGEVWGGWCGIVRRNYVPTTIWHVSSTYRFSSNACCYVPLLKKYI